MPSLTVATTCAALQMALPAGAAFVAMSSPATLLPAARCINNLSLPRYGFSFAQRNTAIAFD